MKRKTIRIPGNLKSFELVVETLSQNHKRDPRSPAYENTEFVDADRKKPVEFVLIVFLNQRRTTSRIDQKEGVQLSTFVAKIPFAKNGFKAAFSFMKENLTAKT